MQQKLGKKLGRCTHQPARQKGIVELADIVFFLLIGHPWPMGVDSRNWVPRGQYLHIVTSSGRVCRRIINYDELLCRTKTRYTRNIKVRLSINSKNNGTSLQGDNHIINMFKDNYQSVEQCTVEIMQLKARLCKILVTHPLPLFFVLKVRL